MADENLNRALGELLGEMKHVAPTIAGLERFSTTLSGEVESLKTELRLTREAMKEYERKIDDRLKEGEGSFGEVQTKLNEHSGKIQGLEDAVTILKESKEKKEERTWQFWFMIISAVVNIVLAAILTAKAFHS